MKKLITIVALLSLVIVAGASVAPAKTDAQPYSAIVPSMTAIAEWVADFNDVLRKQDAYQAFAYTHEEGIAPFDVMSYIEDSEEIIINPQTVVAAAYCAGYKHDDILSASELVGYSDIIVTAGFETAKKVCGDELLDMQAFTVESKHMSAFVGGVQTNTTINLGSTDVFAPIE